MMRRTVFLFVTIAAVITTAAGSRSALAQGHGGYGSHVVAPGETLYSIARYYGADPMAVAANNGLVNPDMIFVGQALTIPGGSDMPSYGYDKPGYDNGSDNGDVSASGYSSGYGDAAVHGYGAKSSGGCDHNVGPGDSLYGIAAMYGTSVTWLMQANGLSNPDVIFVGQSLVIPGCGHDYDSGPDYGGYPVHYPTAECGNRYWVKPGETLSGIAMAHGTTQWDVAAANGLKYPYMIYSGQSLFIPCGSAGYYNDEPSYHHKPGHGHKPPAKAQPALSAAACPREVQIVRPLEKQTVSDVVTIMGTADIDDFQFYKVEYAMGWTPLESAFNSINHTFAQTVVDSVLTTWYVGNMPDGDYTMRLTAVDNQGQFARPCDVHIKIQ